MRGKTARLLSKYRTLSGSGKKELKRWWNGLDRNHKSSERHRLLRSLKDGSSEA